MRTPEIYRDVLTRGEYVGITYNNNLKLYEFVFDKCVFYFTFQMLADACKEFSIAFFFQDGELKLIRY